MDFGELLHAAKKNETTKPQIRYYPTKFAPPKKEHRPKNLSVNIQKFLARKEAEEKQKQQEALEKKNKLLALRSQDKKATRRVNVMLKRTKSANQSVIADALDENNTSVTLVGPSQPDEDDYGYVSQESSALYNKMMEKYSKMPDEPKFPLARKKISTNLSSTKDRVKAALEREKEEAMMPHRRKRKHAESAGDDSERNNEKIVEPESEVEKKESTKVKFKPAPLVNFSDLLKLAEKKQFEPVVIEPKKEDVERPLTKKQKKEQEREREWRERKESRNKGIPEKPPSSNRIPKMNGSTPQTSDKIPKKSSESQDVIRKVPTNKEPTLERVKSLDKNSNLTKSNKVPNSANIPNNNNNNKRNDPPPRILNGTKVAGGKFSEKSRLDSKNMPPPASTLQQARVSSDKSKLLSSSKDQQQLKKQSTINNNSKLKQALQTNARGKQSLPNNPVKSKPIPSKQFPPSDIKPRPTAANNLKPKQFPPADLKPKQFPPADLKPKQFPPADLKPKQFPPADVRRHPKDLQRKAMLNKRRIIDDDEDEYDPDMDDFIDDGPEDEPDYSKYISEIFGYDKRRYRNDDDDVDNMETSFAQQMKEEVISTRIGIMEDLEDMRQEEEAKKRKLLMKKRGKL